MEQVTIMISLPNKKIIGVRHRWDIGMALGMVDLDINLNPDTYSEGVIECFICKKCLVPMIWTGIDARN